MFFFILYAFRIKQGIRLPIWQTKRLSYSCAVRGFLLFLICSVTLNAQGVPVATPPAGKLYHGFYWGGVGTDEHDPSEHDVTPTDVAKYEQAVGKQTAWIYFSDNWFASRKFTAVMWGWTWVCKEVLLIRLILCLHS